VLTHRCYTLHANIRTQASILSYMLTEFPEHQRNLHAQSVWRE
jgi:hypothetical protein